MLHRYMFRSSSWFLLGLLSVTPSFAQIEDPVTISTGQVSGTEPEDGVVAFKGIPYAAPPVGDLRWKPPQPAGDWAGVRASTEFGANCTASGRGRGGATASEDCLYINVWTAAKSPEERRPVFVWTYGGGFTGGSGSQDWYDGAALAKKGLVVVNYNYRLGVFGFFAHPELTAESEHHASGNQGMLDFLAALKWVQENIEGFGGDPNNVTIAGESAGSIAVAAMLGSKLGDGLYNRAIGQSASFMGLNISRQPTREQVEQAAVKAADGKSLAELRALPTQEAAAQLRGVRAGISIDGYVIPKDLSLIYAAGEQNHVDVLVGSNHDEGTFGGFGRVGTAEEFRESARKTYGDMADEFFKLYPADTDEQATASGLERSRDLVAWNMRNWARDEQEEGKNAYLYFFTRVSPGNEERGATHTAELYYMFQNPPPQGWDETDTRLSDQMSSYWANFAAKGDPNGPGLAGWPKYNPKRNDGQAMVFGNAAMFGKQIDTARLDFWDRYYKRYLAELK